MPALHDHGPEPALEAATAADPAVAVEVLAALAGAVRAITLGSSLDRVLHRLAASARDLVGAEYAAIGLPEPEGDQFARFVTVGMSDELIARLGPLPRTHGLLDAMLRDPSPYRTDDITRDPRFRGWWPEAHPQMRSFLGVPIVSAGDIVGAFYLTEKLGAPGFTAADEAAVVLLASHAAIAIDQARLFEDSRELALAQERGRLARELHDSLAQTLFSLRLAAETAASLQADDPAGAAPRSRSCGGWPARRPTSSARSWTASAPPTWSATAWRRPCAPTSLAARAHGGGRPRRRRAAGARPRRRAPGAADRPGGGHQRPPPRRADRVAVRLGPHERRPGAGRPHRATTGGASTPTPRLRSRRLGITSMHERAASVGGVLRIRSAPGRGTTVELEVPR